MTETVVLGESGRIVLPAAIRKELGLKAGDRLTVSSDQGEIRILSRKMALESIRADIVKQRGSLAGLLDEFLAERREEAARE
jgi:AbrB family looped-hinge helix DNA binding protein